MRTYTINRNGQQLGPYSRDEVQRHLNQGLLLQTDLVWKDEDQRWGPLPELLAAPPPLPKVNPAQLSAAVDAQARSAADMAHEDGGAAVPRIEALVLCGTIALWIGLYLPFFSMSLGVVQVSLTFWDFLDFPFNFLGLLIIAAPLAVPFIRHPQGKYLYAAPLAYLLGTCLLRLLFLHQLANNVSAVTSAVPIFGPIAAEGIQAAMKTASLDYGAYILAVSSLFLGLQVFMSDSRSDISRKANIVPPSPIPPAEQQNGSGAAVDPQPLLEPEAIFVGEKYDTYYKPRWAAMKAQDAQNSKRPWNWAAMGAARQAQKGKRSWNWAAFVFGV